MLSIDSIQRNLPAITALAIVAALTYVGGFMNYAGVEWIGMFDIGDIFSLSWPIASGATIFLLGGVALGQMIYPLARETGAAPGPTKVVKPISKFWLILLIVLPLIGARIVMKLPVEFGVFAIIAPLAAGVLYEVLRRRLDSTQNFAVLSVLTLTFCFCAGIALGSLPFNSRSATLVQLSDDTSLCGRMITPLRRGALIAVDRSSVVFLEWSRIESLRTNARCSVTNA